LAYASQGFGSVAANEIPIAVAGGRHEVARQVYATSFAFMLGIAVVGMAIVLLLLPVISWASFLDTVGKREREIQWAVVFLALAMFASFLGELFYGRFRAAERAHQAILINSSQSWIELLFLFGVLQFSTRFDYLAAGVLGGTLTYLLVYGTLSYFSYRDLTFRLADVRVEQFRNLFYKGFAFQAFPLGNALLFQGNLLAVQLILGPTAVALFGTVRTLVRVLNQALEVVSKSIWPELSYLFGKGNTDGIRSLHRLGVGLCVVLAVAGVIGLAAFGPFLYDLWVGDSIALSFSLLLFFLLPIPFNALWLTSSTVLMACNRHQGLARRYVLATALATIGCAGLTWLMGLRGAAFSTVIADLILIPYVLHHALILSEDSFGSFLAGTVAELRATAQKLLSRWQTT
jgi:O-antigen/teichoic acid export membrane protein